MRDRRIVFHSLTPLHLKALAGLRELGYTGPTCEGQRSLSSDFILAISLRDFKGSGAVLAKAGLDDIYDGIDGSSRYSIFSLTHRGSDSESF